MIDVYIADDHSIVREGIRALIASTADMHVVGEAADGDQALEAVVRTAPQVLLMDMTMPDCSGLELVEKLHRRAPETLILVLSMHREEFYAPRAIRAGARGFITKSRAPQELLEALRTVSRGQIYIPRELADRLARESLMGKSNGELHTRLTKREYEIFIGLAQGSTVGELGARLHLSSKTISTHKARLMDKLEINSLSELVRYAIKHELV